MITDRIYLNGGKSEYFDVFLPKFLDDEPRKVPAVIVCPGGGYNFCSAREADVIAANFMAQGFATFVLYYSLKEKAAMPAPLLDLCETVKTVRERADEWNIDTDKIGVIGFSAGGHLTASLGVYWNNEEIKKLSGCQNGENKPNAIMLIYPVLSCSWAAPDGKMREHLVGGKDNDTQYDFFNICQKANRDTPPTFLCHTFRDTAVPVEDSLNFAQSLAKEDIPFEMHIFPNGHHGLSTGNAALNWGNEYADFNKWPALCTAWLRRVFENTQEAASPVKRAHFTAEV